MYQIAIFPSDPSIFFLLQKNTFWNVLTFWNVSWNITISEPGSPWDPLWWTGVFSLVVIGSAWVHCCGIRGCFSHEAHLSYGVRFGGNDCRELFVWLPWNKPFYNSIEIVSKSQLFSIFLIQWWRPMVKMVVSSEEEWLWRPTQFAWFEHRWISRTSFTLPIAKLKAQCIIPRGFQWSWTILVLNIIISFSLAGLNINIILLLCYSEHDYCSLSTGWSSCFWSAVAVWVISRCQPINVS